MPSFQLQQYLQARADGATVGQAAEQSGIGLGEAELHEADIERGELELPEPRARACTREDEQPGGTEMEFNPATDTGQRLKLFVERAERLDEEIKGLNEDKSDLFKEMKSDGFDTKTVKRIIKLRKMGAHERQEAEALLSTYLDALGMTPIEAAIAIAA